MVPGMNVLAILFAYLVNDFIFAFMTVISLTLFWCIMSWLTYEKIFLKRFSEGFKKEKLFKVLQHWAHQDQFKMSLLLRNLIIPLFYKNMFLMLLNTTFLNYILSAALVEGSHMVAYTLIGDHLREIKKYRNAKKNQDQYNDWVFWFKSVFTLVVIFFNFYFVYKTYKKRKNLEKNVDQKKEQQGKKNSDEISMQEQESAIELNNLSTSENTFKEKDLENQKISNSSFQLIIFYIWIQQTKERNLSKQFCNKGVSLSICNLFFYKFLQRYENRNNDLLSMNLEYKQLNDVVPNKKDLQIILFNRMNDEIYYGCFLGIIGSLIAPCAFICFNSLIFYKIVLQSSLLNDKLSKENLQRQRQFMQPIRLDFVAYSIYILGVATGLIIFQLNLS